MLLSSRSRQSFLISHLSFCFLFWPCATTHVTLTSTCVDIDACWKISFAWISMHARKYLFRFSILQHVGYLFVFCMHSSKMQHGETTLRSHKIYFVRSRRPLLLQFRELSNNMEETSNASVPGFVLAPAPNIEGAEESAKYHHEKTTAAKLEIEKTLKVSPQIKDVLRMLIFLLTLSSCKYKERA